MFLVEQLIPQHSREEAFPVFVVPMFSGSSEGIFQRISTFYIYYKRNGGLAPELFRSAFFWKEGSQN